MCMQRRHITANGLSKCVPKHHQVLRAYGQAYGKWNMGSRDLPYSDRTGDCDVKSLGEFSLDFDSSCLCRRQQLSKSRHSQLIFDNVQMLSFGFIPASHHDIGAHEVTLSIRTLSNHECCYGVGGKHRKRTGTR